MADRQSDDAPADPYAGAAPTAIAPELPPAGWYPDPERVGERRYWDGQAWGTHRTIDATLAGPRPASAPRTRTSVVVIASVVGGLALLALFGWLLGAVVPAIVAAASGAGDSRELTAAAPAPGVELQVMGGRGTITVDPAWEDISAISGTDAIEAQIVAETGIDSEVAGAWLLGGDLVDGGVSLLAYSAGDVGGPTASRIEALAFLRSSTAGIDDVVVTSEGAVTTATGVDGYVIEYGFPLYGIQVTNAIGVVVEGSSVMIVSTSGSEELGSGVGDLEAVLNSLQID